MIPIGQTSPGVFLFLAEISFDLTPFCLTLQSDVIIEPRENANMNDQPRQSLTIEDQAYPPPQGAFPVWWKAFMKPGKQTFMEITEHPEAKAKSAYIWVFIAATLASLINTLVEDILDARLLVWAIPNVHEDRALKMLGDSLGMFGSLCGMLVGGLFAVAAFAIWVGIIQITAKALGGQGSFDKLAYVLGAITVPVLMIYSPIAPLNRIGFMAVCVSPLLLALALYMLFLEFMAIKALHGFGWGAAATSLFLPNILLFLLCGVMFFGLFGPADPVIRVP